MEAIKAKISERKQAFILELTNNINELKSVDGLDYVLRQYITKDRLKNGFNDLEELKAYLFKRVNTHFDKAESKLNKEVDRLNELNRDVKFIKISVEWKRNRTWGSNPTATIKTNTGVYVSSSIGGCGYCKESTAISEALNEIDELRRLLCQNKEACNDVRGLYLPYIAGGAGVGTIRKSLELLGFKFICEDSGKSFNTYYFEKA